MKQYTPPLIIMVLSGLFCSMVHAQEPVWLKQYGNGNSNMGLKLAYDGQSGLYGVGTVAAPTLELDDTTVAVLGSQDILLAKWDTSGGVVWARTAGGVCGLSELESGGGIVYDGHSGHVIISGQFDCGTTYFGNHVLNGSQNGGKDRFIAAYDDTGECLWARSATGFDVSLAKLLIDPASRVFVFGRARTAGISFHGSPTITLPPGGFIAKYASDGTLLNAERVVVNGELGQADWLTADRWVLTGSAKPNASLFGQSLQVTSSQQDGFVARADTTGTVEWVTMFPSSGSVSVFRSAVLADGRVAVCGYFVDDLVLPQDTLYGAPGVWTFYVAVLDANGAIEWALPIAAAGVAIVYDIKADLNGDILLYGRYDGNLSLAADTLSPYASTSGFVARFSPAGQCMAAWGFGRTYHGSGSILPTDHGLYLSTEFDSTLVMGSYMVQGTFTGEDQGLHDLLIARFDSLSGFTGVQALKSSGVERLHIYANPNNGVCTIQLPATVRPGSDLVLTIHDAMGRVVQQAPLRWSEGTIQLDIRAQARGVYHAELLDGKQRYSGTIVFE